MRKWLLKRKILSTIIIVLLTASIFLSIPNLRSQEGEEPPPEDQPPPPGDVWNQSSWNGTLVSWDKQHETSQDSWSWISQAWEFGPYPTFTIYLMNETEITDDNFIPLGEPFKVVIDVQKTVFTGNTTLGRAGLNWHMELLSQNGTYIGYADCRMGYVNKIVTKYWNESDTWHTESSIFNSSEVSAPPGQPPPPQPNKTIGQVGFYHFDKNLSRVTEFSELWRIEIVGSFNETTTPKGPFWVNLEVTDSSDNRIDFGYLAWSGNRSPNRMIAVGKPGLVYGGFEDTWTFEKLDMENKSVYSVSRGALWKMRINVTCSDLANVTIAFRLDYGLKTYVNVTNWYQKTVTEYGGWVYNETSGAYYWNGSMPVTRTVQVYGPHLEERCISQMPTDILVNVTRQYWNETGRYLINVTEHIWDEKMYLIYDHLTHEFTVKQGYSYWSYDPTINGDREFRFLEPLNTSNPATQFYNLSIENSHCYQTGPKEYVIEFVGYFSNTTYSNMNAYSVEQPIVYSSRYQIWPNWEKISPSDFQIAVDKLVAVTTIIDTQGREVKGWMFQVDPSEFFIIQSKLYGANVKYKDIDGFGVIFRGGEGKWVSSNESYWSDIQIRLVKDLTSGEIISQTYNRTSKDVYVYGPYRGWKPVNVTEWVQEFNATAGEWKWVERQFLRWNETTLIGWHWEHLSLNQTEYARNPNSAKIWINREYTWLPDDDPAFRMPSSYAVLDSADMSLIEGMVTVNMNITFSSNAPQCRYWWDLTFKNMTYGVDWSQGWGEHTITEWTSEPIYYVNGSATGYEAWYVTKPSTPLYTVYNGSRYKLEEIPYITIDGSNLLIKVRTQYDWGRQDDVKQYLFYDQYDPQLGKQPRYYELLNGTKIYVQEGYQAAIRTLKLNCTDAYEIVGGSFVTLLNGTVFCTFMDHAEQDWSKQIWNATLGYWVAPYYYELLNGTRVYKNEKFEDQMFNWTTQRCDLSNRVYTENATSLMVDYAGRGVALNYTIVVLLRDSGAWWQPLMDGTGYYLVMKNGTRIIHKNPWSVPDEQRIVTINGVNYTISWPTDYYTATYQNRTLLIKRGDGGQGYVRNFYYTDLGVDGGVKYELPYPRARATSWWDLEGIESESHRLKTFKSFTLNGTKYVLYPSEDGKGCYIIVDGERVPVTWPMMEIGYYYAQLNGEEYWKVAQIGWILRFGTHSEMSGRFTPIGSPFVTTTGYDPMERTWSEHNRYGYDWENSTLYILAPNGTRYDLQSAINIIVWKVDIGGEYYYAMDQCSQSEQEYDNKTGQWTYKSYIMTLNGTKVYFDWATKPAAWIEEIHISVPGTNYTRLIPFNWTMQRVFDTLYIFNITIPALPWNLTHTGVLYADGTEVPVNATFKTYGTILGPGTRGMYDLAGNFNPQPMPHIPAPWNPNMSVSYFTALNGTRIYSESNFGWMGNRWGNWSLMEPFRQWNYINDDPVAGNKTVNAVVGGYCVYLNDTIKFDVTTSCPQGGMPDQYLIMKNGTYFNIHWIYELGLYITMMGNSTYLFRNVITYYNFTDSGTVYYLSDPVNNDPTQILTPTSYLAPTVSNDRLTWLWINSTNEGVLHDVQGYYLINASDFSRLDLGLVDDWWNLPEKIRTKVFSQIGELYRFSPRYNVTINGQEYFVIDPSPVTGSWSGEHDIEWALYRYPNAVNVTLDETAYTIVLFDQGYWRPNLRWRRYETVTVTNGSALEVEEQNCWKPAYQVSIDGQLTDIQLAEMNIYKRHTMWGQVYRWMLTDLNVYTVRSIWDLVVGTPDLGMWGIRAFATVPETGAVDLDGDLSTTEDQYFVRTIHTGSDSWNQTVDRMWVELVWNPNSSTIGDEMHIGAWMGKLRTSWGFTWNETYIWYYASNMSLVSHETMQQINSTLLNSKTGLPNAGYWEIARMAKNVTWADVLAQAKKEGWDWIKDNKNEWEWLWFGTQQDYMTGWVQDGMTQTASIGLRYEFAGLSLYNNTEQTHFFMPKNVGNITLVTPGEAFGNMNATGNMIVPENETVTFGVNYDNVNGTLFPYSEDRSMWGWWDGVIYGADFNAPNFMYRPTESMIKSLSLIIHFSANNTLGQELNNEASMKIDQRVGDWELGPNVIDGRTQNVSNVMVYLRGNDVLLNRSLAINYYVTAMTGMAWDVKDDMGASIDNNNVTESSRFDVAASFADANFATVRLGSTYDWYKPISTNDTVRTLNVTSKTLPLGAFKASYQSDAGKSSAGFDISSMMYFLTVGFPRWDGYAVYNDPQVSAFVFKGAPSSVFVDNIPPEISVPVQEPSENVTPYQNVTVTVNVTDAGSGVFNVTLWYSVDSGTNWAYLEMTEISPNTYQAAIPGYENSTWITYKIIAYDNNENQAVNDNHGYYYTYHVIPEFPSATILPLFIILTMLTVVFAKKRLPRKLDT